jgi:hypothetical protein
MKRPNTKRDLSKERGGKLRERGKDWVPNNV